MGAIKAIRQFAFVTRLNVTTPSTSGYGFFQPNMPWPSGQPWSFDIVGYLIHNRSRYLSPYMASTGKVPWFKVGSCDRVV